MRIILFLSLLLTAHVSSMSLEGYSGMITSPSAFCSNAYSYQKIGPEIYYSYTNTMVFNRIEYGLRKNQDDGSAIYSGKMRIFDMTAYTPALALGVYDINHPNKKPSYYAAASYILPETGTSFHFGIVNEGNYNDILSIRNIESLTPYFDRDERETYYYVGIEQTIVPMIAVMAEYKNEVVSAGLRLNLMSTLVIDAIQRDVRNDLSLSEKRAYSIAYTTHF